MEAKKILLNVQIGDGGVRKSEIEKEEKINPLEQESFSIKCGIMKTTYYGLGTSGYERKESKVEYEEIIDEEILEFSEEE